MPKFSAQSTFIPLFAAEPHEYRFISRRKVRNIITPSGRGVRGYFPSLKAKSRLKFESLGEEDVSRVFDVAPSVQELVTQPCVFEFESDGKRIRYTPDILACIAGQKYYVEVKCDGFTKNPDVVSHLRHVISRFNEERLRFVLILDSDVRENDLQTELKQLQRLRPQPRPRRTVADKNQWGLSGEQEVPCDLEHRWKAAQRVCDALIQRVMRRDPEDLLPESQA